MKRYKLLKELPTFKAGEEFFISESGNLIAGTPRNPKQITVETSYGLPMKIDLMAYAQETLEEFPNILKDWFKEIKASEEYFYIDSNGDIEYSKSEWNEEIVEQRKLIGNYFETKEEAEKYLEYLKAKVVIKRDTKGFKPDWTDKKTRKYYGYWDFERGFKNYFEGGKPSWDSLQTTKESNIYFESWEDIEKSFAKHPEEWKAYLTYEQ